MTLILDSGGLTALAVDRQRLRAVVGFWPPCVPSVVLAEALTGDHRRDHRTNELLRRCEIREVSEADAREAARLRTATGRAGTINAVDAVVAAVAETVSDPVVLTSDPDRLAALARHARRPIEIVNT